MNKVSGPLLNCLWAGSRLEARGKGGKYEPDSLTALLLIFVLVLSKALVSEELETLQR